MTSDAAPQLSLGIFVGHGAHLDDAGIGSADFPADDASHTGLRAGWKLGNVLVIEGELRLGSATFTDFKGSLHTLGYRAGVLLHLTPGDLSPFVSFGHGSDSFFTQGKGFDGARGLVANHVGLGLKFKRGESVGLRLETRAVLNRAEGRTGTGLFEVDAGVYVEF